MNPLATLRDMILAAHAAGDAGTADWLAGLAADPAALARVTGTDRAESEPPGDDLARVLLEHGFTGTDRLGRKWVDGKEVAGGGTGKGETPGGSGAHAPPPAAHTTGGLAAAVASADPAAAKTPGLLKKIEGAAVKAGARVYLFLLKNHDRIEAAKSILGAYLDTPDDLKKLGYNPTNAGVQPAGGSHDPARAAGLPISGHLAARIAAHVLVKSLAWAKAKLGGKTESLHESAGDAVRAAAELLAEAFAAVHEALGLGAAPDADAFERGLRAARGE